MGGEHFPDGSHVRFQPGLVRRGADDIDNGPVCGNGVLRQGGEHGAGVLESLILVLQKARARHIYDRKLRGGKIPADPCRIVPRYLRDASADHEDGFGGIQLFRQAHRLSDLGFPAVDDFPVAHDGGTLADGGHIVHKVGPHDPEIAAYDGMEQHYAVPYAAQGVIASEQHAAL